MTLMSGPSYEGAVNMPSEKQERRINVHFRIPYMTRWGQSMVVAGSGVFVVNTAAAGGDAALQKTKFRVSVVVIPT